MSIRTSDIIFQAASASANDTVIVLAEVEPATFRLRRFPKTAFDGPQGSPGTPGADGSDGAAGTPGTNGVAGTTGTNGAPGSVWREGSGAPANGLGVDGDFYLDGDNGDVYQKAAGVYTLVANIQGPNFTHSTLTYAATTDLDFDADDYRSLTLAGNVTFTTSNRAAPKALSIRIIADGSIRTLTFPAGWIFVGSAAPASIAANKEAILSITCFGTTDALIRAAYAVEP